MGNVILKSYDYDSARPVSRGGIGQYWTIYDGVSKKDATKQVSIHMLVKDALPRHLRTEAFYDLIRRDCSILVRLRHPRILNLLHPLDESRGAFVMVTERVLGSVAQLMLHTPPAPVDGKFQLKNGVKTDAALADRTPLVVAPAEIKNGLRQLCEAVVFTHTTAKMYHSYLDPCNVYVTDDDNWMLGGFYFATSHSRYGELVSNSVALSSLTDDATTSASAASSSSATGGRRGSDAASSASLTDIASDIARLVSLTYAAPELVLHDKHDHRADSFSLARIAQHLLFAHHRHPRLGVGVDEFAPATVSQYEHMTRYLHPLSRDDQWLGGAESEVAVSLTPLLLVDADARAPVSSFLNSAYFCDTLTQTLRFLDTLLDRDVDTRIAFFQQLPDVLCTFTESVVRKKILPALLLQLKDETLANFCLPSLFAIVATMQRHTFQETVQSHMLPLMSAHVINTRPDTAFYCIKHFDTLVSLTTTTVHTSHLLPLLTRALASAHTQLQEAALKRVITPCLERTFSFAQVKTDVLPHVVTLCVRPAAAADAAAVSVKVSALITLNAIFVTLDTATIETSVLGAVDQCVAAPGAAAGDERHVAVLMCCAGIYDTVSAQLGHRVTAQRLLPAVSPLTLEPKLNAKQFDCLVNVMDKMLARIRSQSAAKEKQDFVKRQTVALRASSASPSAGGDGDGGSGQGQQTLSSEEAAAAKERLATFNKLIRSSPLTTTTSTSSAAPSAGEAASSPASSVAAAAASAAAGGAAAASVTATTTSSSTSSPSSTDAGSTAAVKPKPPPPKGKPPPTAERRSPSPSVSSSSSPQPIQPAPVSVAATAAFDQAAADAAAAVRQVVDNPLAMMTTLPPRQTATTTKSTSPMTTTTTTTTTSTPTDRYGAAGADYTSSTNAPTTLSSVSTRMADVTVSDGVYNPPAAAYSGGGGASGGVGSGAVSGTGGAIAGAGFGDGINGMDMFAGMQTTSPSLQAATTTTTTTTTTSAADDAMFADLLAASQQTSPASHTTSNSNIGGGVGSAGAADMFSGMSMSPVASPPSSLTSSMTLSPTSPATGAGTGTAGAGADIFAFMDVKQ